MTNSKNIFNKLITPLTPAIAFRLFRKSSRRRVLIPLYHSVSDEPPRHLSYLYKIRNIKAFTKDLDTLLKYYKPIDLSQLLDFQQDKRQGEKPFFHLTFDDGLAEFDSVIAPILLKKGIPATCFLNSDFIDNKNMLFRFKASLLIDKLHQAAPGSEIWKKFHEWTEDNKLVNKYYRIILLNIGYGNKQLLDELAQKLELDFDAYLKKQKPYLERSQIESLIKKGFTFGAHSVDHPEYRFIDENEQIEQTLKSIKNITETFGLTYKVFSFPFTDHEVSRNFYTSIENDVDLTFGCAGIKRDAIPFNLQRIPFEDYNENMISILKKEYLYHSLLKLLGKDEIKRIN